MQSIRRDREYVTAEMEGDDLLAFLRCASAELGRPVGKKDQRRFGMVCGGDIAARNTDMSRQFGELPSQFCARLNPERCTEEISERTSSLHIADPMPRKISQMFRNRNPSFPRTNKTRSLENFPIDPSFLRLFPLLSSLFPRSDWSTPPGRRSLQGQENGGYVVRFSPMRRIADSGFEMTGLSFILEPIEGEPRYYRFLIPTFHRTQ